MAAVTDNILIPLPDMILERDFAWRVNFITAVDTQLRRLRSSGRFQAPRFFGYFFQGRRPLGVSGNWVVPLEPVLQLVALQNTVERLTQGQYRISSENMEKMPDFILVNDSYDGACWLWRFNFGLRFVEAVEPFGPSGGLQNDLSSQD